MVHYVVLDEADCMLELGLPFGFGFPSWYLSRETRENSIQDLGLVGNMGT